MKKQVLHINVGHSKDVGIVKATTTTHESIKPHETITTHFSLAIDDISTMLNVLTPKRWMLIDILRDCGAMPVSELAQLSGRHYNNVHQDVAMMLEWRILESNEQGQVYVPFDELLLDVKML